MNKRNSIKEVASGPSRAKVRTERYLLRGGAEYSPATKEVFGGGPKSILSPCLRALTRGRQWKEKFLKEAYGKTQKRDIQLYRLHLKKNFRRAQLCRRKVGIIWKGSLWRRMQPRDPDTRVRQGS